MSSPSSYPLYNFPDLEDPFPAANLPFEIAMSSPNVLAAPVPKSKSAQILQMSAMDKRIRVLEAEVGILSTTVSDLEEQKKVDAAQFEKLKLSVRTLWERSKEAAVTAAAAAQAMADDDDDENEMEMLTKEQKREIEASTAAANSNVVKVSNMRKKMLYLITHQYDLRALYKTCLLISCALQLSPPSSFLLIHPVKMRSQAIRRQAKSCFDSIGSETGKILTIGRGS